jgi:hypothetical protein
MVARIVSPLSCIKGTIVIVIVRWADVANASRSNLRFSEGAPLAEVDCGIVYARADEGAEGKQMKIAILDNYHNVALRTEKEP